MIRLVLLDAAGREVLWTLTFDTTISLYKLGMRNHTLTSSRNHYYEHRYPSRFREMFSFVRGRCKSTSSQRGVIYMRHSAEQLFGSTRLLDASLLPASTQTVAILIGAHVIFDRYLLKSWIHTYKYKRITTVVATTPQAQTQTQNVDPTNERATALHRDLAQTLPTPITNHLHRRDSHPSTTSPSTLGRTETETVTRYHQLLVPVIRLCHPEDRSFRRFRFRSLALSHSMNSYFMLRIGCTS